MGLLRRLFGFGRRAGSAASSTGHDESAEAARRAELFWRRWEELLPQVGSALGDGVPQRVDHQIAEAVALLHPGLNFSIERGREAIYALVITAQADPELRVYTDAWRAAAPTTDSLWEYHDAVPPVPDPREVTVNLGGRRYPLEEVRVSALFDEARHLVDVAVYHPGFAELAGNEREALTFLPLHAALGEKLAADRIGRVETAERLPENAVDLVVFRDRVRVFDTEGTEPPGADPGPR
ncbi:hypothetical protein CDG81_06815 [Actinopolyspora erythraea]|uniref:DUF695 domain-containing protein n=1 Tax=Actinopolyspora erythraea TaxID=414996 RepID=A0A223RQC2_9ACTN|nr:hypothetical protein [Actinopolyspora erythraea]ASU78066.1 hypothetical protein CDG81_06815 [Actinopolyspora erythraea]